jgi:DNA-binding MarR family transcriptional regulator
MHDKPSSAADEVGEGGTVPVADGSAEQAGSDTVDTVDTVDAVDAVLASSRALVAVSARSIAATGGVTLPQYRMLVVLADGSTNLTTLSAHLDVAASTALRMVDRLVSAGLVERTVRPDNRRETHLSLTTAGRRTVRTVTARRRRDITAIISGLDAGQRLALVEAMAAFARAADDLWPGIAAD